MPASLVRQARATLAALETQQQAGEAQVDLFAVPNAPAEASSPLHDALAAIDPDKLSPRDALDALYRIKQLHDEATS
jgi:DNA mismatch repair protein MutS